MIVLFLFFFRDVTVDGASMHPTLHGGEYHVTSDGKTVFINHADTLIISDFFYTPATGDIVVLNVDKHSQPLIKRVIAVEGQEVEIFLEASICVKKCSMSKFSSSTYSFSAVTMVSGAEAKSTPSNSRVSAEESVTIFLTDMVISFRHSPSQWAASIRVYSARTADAIYRAFSLSPQKRPTVEGHSTVGRVGFFVCIFAKSCYN
jgi:signal peptidase I